VLVADADAEIGFAAPHPLGEITELATAALLRTRNEVETTRARRWQELIATSPRRLHAAATSDAVVAQIARSLRQALGAQATAVVLGADTPPRPASRLVGARAEASAAVAREAQDLDRVVVSRPSSVEILARTAIQAAAAPLHDARGNRIGTLCVEIPVLGIIATDDDMRPLATLADIVALALDVQTTRRAARIAQRVDPETGCLDADGLLPAIAAAIDAGRAARRESALLVIQIDRRDAPIDPRVTRALGERLAEMASAEAFQAFRTRPWQFTLVAPALALREARQLAHRVRLLVRRGLPDGLAATASVGIALAPMHASEPEALRAAADAALDAALAAGPDADAVARGAPPARPSDRPGIGERLEMLRSLARLVDDIHFGGKAHGEAVAQRARTLGAILQFTHAELQSLVLAGELHDIGRSMLPYAIFLEQHPDARTLAMIKSHVVLASRLIATSGFPRAAEAVGSIHEYWDGNGAPGRLAGERIPIGGRVLAIANAFETILNNLGRDLNGYAEAARHLAAERGRMFDPHIVDALLRHTASAD
jgi:GGDEF domain-containing protein